MYAFVPVKAWIQTKTGNIMKKSLWNFFLTAAYVNKGGNSFTMFGF